MDTLDDFAIKNPGLKPADTLRRYSQHTKLELLKSGWDQQLADDIDQELLSFGAENMEENESAMLARDLGIKIEGAAPVPAREEEDDLRLTTQFMQEQDPALADAARSYLVAQSDETRSRFGDPKGYEDNLAMHKKSYEDLITPEVRNKVKRDAMKSGDLPFAMVDGALEFSPLMHGAVGNDEALVKMFEAYPTLDKSLIPAVKQKLAIAPGYDVPGFDLDRQSDFYGTLQSVMSKDPEIAEKMKNLIGAYELDKDTGKIHQALDMGEPGVNDDPVAAAIASRLDLNHGLRGEFSPDEMQRFIKDFAKTTASPQIQEGDVDANVTKLSTGQAVLPMGVLMNKTLFDKTMSESKTIPAEQKDALMKTREARISAYAPDAFKVIADNRPEFASFLTEKKEAGATNAAILDEWMSNPDNHSSFRDYAGGIGESIAEGFGGLVLYPAALMGNESARGVLADLQKSDSDRRAYARLFGKNLGVGYDLSRLIAPVAADISVSLLTGGVAAPLIGGKNVAKTGIKNILRTSLSPGARGAITDFTMSAAKRAAGGKSLASVMPDEVLSLAGKDIASKLTTGINTASYLGTAFTRSAGSTYVQLHTQLSDQTNPDGSKKYSQEQTREIALNHGLIAGTITAAITGGFSMFGKAGMEGIYNGITRKQLNGIYDRMGASIKGLSPAVKAEISMESPEKMLESIMRKSLGPVWGKGFDAVKDEALEEGLDQAMGYINQQIATGDKIDPIAMAKEAVYASFLGGAMGGTVTGINSVTRGAGVRNDQERSVLLDTARKLDTAQSPQTAAVLRKFAQQLGTAPPAAINAESPVAINAESPVAINAESPVAINAESPVGFTNEQQNTQSQVSVPPVSGYGLGADPQSEGDAPPALAPPIQEAGLQLQTPTRGTTPGAATGTVSQVFQEAGGTTDERAIAAITSVTYDESEGASKGYKKFKYIGQDSSGADVSGEVWADTSDTAFYHLKSKPGFTYGDLAEVKAVQPKIRPTQEMQSSQDTAVAEASAWDRSHKNQIRDAWFDGGKIDPAALKGYNDAMQNGGSQLQAHGMAKESTASGAIKNLTDLLLNGLDPNRGSGFLDTAPLVAEAGAGLAGATASGAAYNDGPFTLVARPGQNLTGDLSGLGAVIINQANAAQVDSIRKAIHAVRPDLIVEVTSDAGSVVSRLLSPQSTSPVAINAESPVAINAELLTPREFNTQALGQLKQGLEKTTVSVSQTVLDSGKKKTTKHKASELITKLKSEKSGYEALLRCLEGK